MRRFLMFVGVAVVAAAMYVAASSASQVSNGPTTKQFAALKKQVKVLAHENKVVIGVLSACMQGALPINQFGDPTGELSGVDQGYVYATGGTGPVLGVTSYTTGLDVTSSSDMGALWITGSTGNTKCRTALVGVHHAAAKAGIKVQPLRLPSSFAVHHH
jgi:hypothetical protein